jgi:hypothetical protein
MMEPLKPKLTQQSIRKPLSVLEVLQNLDFHGSQIQSGWFYVV